MFKCFQCGGRMTPLSASTGSEAEALMGDTCTFCRSLMFFRRCEGGDSKMVGPPQKAHKCDAAEGQRRVRGRDSIGDGRMEGWSSDGRIAIATKPVLGQGQKTLLMRSVQMPEKLSRSSSEQGSPQEAHCKAQEGVPMPTKRVPMPRQDEYVPSNNLAQDSHSDSEASSTVTLTNAESRSVYGADNDKLRSERSACEIPQKRDSLQPRLKCEPKAMRRLARTRLHVSHLLKTTKMELRKLEEQKQALENMARKNGNQRQSESGGAKPRDSEPHSNEQLVRHLTIKVSTVMRCTYQPIGHLLVDHQSPNEEQVGLSQAKTLYLDPKTLQLNEATCIMLYQGKDKTTDSQAGQKGDPLPVLVMAARAQFSASNDHSQAEQREFLLVWLSCFQQRNEFRNTGSLSVYSQLSDREDTLTVLTTQLYDISAPQHMAAIFRSPSTLIVPHVLLRRMTNSGQHPIAIQVRFH